MAAESTVDANDFYATLQKIRDLRAWAVRKKIDPWAFRQALITCLELDTQAALERNVRSFQLIRFDARAHQEAVDFVKGLK